MVTTSIDMDLKTCFKCLEPKPIDEFYRHSKMADGHLGKCKKCAKEDSAAIYSSKNGNVKYERVREQRPERKSKKATYQRAYRSKNPEKYKARTAVGNAVRAGSLKRLPCEVCGDTKSQAHHDDYSKPFDIKWLCFKHHREREHGQIIRAA